MLWVVCRCRFSIFICVPHSRQVTPSSDVSLADLMAGTGLMLSMAVCSVMADQTSRIRPGNWRELVSLCAIYEQTRLATRGRIGSSARAMVTLLIDTELNRTQRSDGIHQTVRGGVPVGFRAHAFRPRSDATTTDHG